MNGPLQSLAGFVTGCAGCDSTALFWLQAASSGVTAGASLALAGAAGVSLRRRAPVRARGMLAVLASFFAASGLIRLLAAALPWSPGRAVPTEAAALLSLIAAFMLWRVLAQPSPAETRQRAIYNNIPVPMHALDPEGSIVNVSDQWLTLLGYTREEVVGRKLTQFLAAESPGALAEDWQLLLADGAEQDVARQVRCKSGEVRDVLASARVARDEAGAVTGVQGVLVDVTARRRAEGALRQALKMEAAGRPAGGLAQITAFVRQPGGMVRRHGTEGCGPRVGALLPRAEPAQPAAAEAREARPARPEPAGGESVLVVEDEAGVRQVVIEALEGLGYRVLAAGDAEEALGVLGAHPEIDLLFTDIVMPGGMDGVDLALEATRRRPDLPVLFTTGYSNRALAGRWGGEVGLLQKPYRIEALAHQIRARLGARDSAGNTGRALRAAGA